MATITAGELADFQRPQRVRLSPDGKHVIYTMKRRWNRDKDMKASLWMAEVGKENSSRQLTSGDYNDSDAEFSPDGKHISFVSDRRDRGKSAVIYLLPFKTGGEALPLTPVDKEQSIGGYQWSPNCKLIAFMSSDEKSEEKKKKEKDGDDPDVYGEWEHSRLRTINVESREINTIVSQEAHVSDLAWSPDSKSLAYVTRKSSSAEHWMSTSNVHVVDCESKNSRELCHFPTATSSFNWYRNELLFKANQDGKSLQSSHAFWRVNVETGKTETALFDPESCAQDLRVCGGEMILYRCHGLSDYLDRYPSGDRIFQSRFDLESGWAVHQNTVVYVKNSQTGGNVCSQVDGKETQLSKHDSLSISVKKKIAVETKAEDGTPVDGWLYIPEPANGATVVLVHGGPYGRYIDGSEDFMGFFEWLLVLGYTVLRPNYRGGMGHGPKYAESVVGDPSVAYPDVISCLEYCISQSYIKKERIAIVGWSFGGYMTYVAVTRDKTFHFDAAIAGAGISDIDALGVTCDIPAFAAEIAGRAPWLTQLEDTRARKGSPLFHMDDIHTPLLMLHGEKDLRVPVSQCWGFHRGMLARNKECELVVYPREGHGFPVPFERTHYVHFLNKIKDFLGKHLKVE